jgi:transitional endoplasmic reticulum ATPase
VNGGVSWKLLTAPAQGVTSEMLKLIPPFREQDERLLICATNSVRALDSAFLRHGRFDYVIPIGPPDPAARAAIWDRYLTAIPHGDLDMAAIVEESRLFTLLTSSSPHAGRHGWCSSACYSSAARRK